jgi:hypothetical protein
MSLTLSCEESSTDEPIWTEEDERQFQAEYAAWLMEFGLDTDSQLSRQAYILEFGIYDWEEGGRA